jgi:hypothetical protein
MEPIDGKPQIGYPNFVHDDVKSDLPRRLLHVPSMTSYQVNEDGCYNGVSNPLYNCFSYTWGRWETADGPRLKIHGVPWEAPAIKPSWFTVSDLEAALNNALEYEEQDWSGQGSEPQMKTKRVDWLWLDIACIDQNDNGLKMQELGKQAAIFRGATRVYIWLCSLSELSLERSIRSIRTHGLDVEAKVLELFLGHRRPAKVPNEAELLEELGSVQNLFADPWFSGVWTLQEMFLTLTWAYELHGFFLARGGSKSTATLGWLSQNTGDGLYSFLSDLLHSDHVSDVQKTMLEKTMDSIDRSGPFGKFYSATPNPYRLLGHVGDRWARHEEDRVYGIMQVFDVKVGQAVHPDGQFTKDALMVQFAATLNERNSALAQSFVFSTIKPRGTYWAIREDIQIPSIITNFVEPVTAEAKISVANVHAQSTPLTWATIKCKACSWRTLSHRWEQLNRLSRLERLRKGQGWEPFGSVFGMSAANQSHGPDKQYYSCEEIMLDQSEYLLDEMKDDASLTWLHDARNMRLARTMLDRYGDKLHVLLVGVGMIHHWDTEISCCIGVVAIKDTVDDESYWQRMGICIWENCEGLSHALDLLDEEGKGPDEEKTTAEVLEERYAKAWFEVEGYYG